MFYNLYWPNWPTVECSPWWAQGCCKTCKVHIAVAEHIILYMAKWIFNQPRSSPRNKFTPEVFFVESWYIRKLSTINREKGHQFTVFLFLYVLYVPYYHSYCLLHCYLHFVFWLLQSSFSIIVFCFYCLPWYFLHSFVVWLYGPQPIHCESTLTAMSHVYTL